MIHISGTCNQYLCTKFGSSLMGIFLYKFLQMMISPSLLEHINMFSFLPE